jgi:hypothetical protein
LIVNERLMLQLAASSRILKVSQASADIIKYVTTHDDPLLQPDPSNPFSSRGSCCK